MHFACPPIFGAGVSECAESELPLPLPVARWRGIGLASSSARIVGTVRPRTMDSHREDMVIRSTDRAVDRGDLIVKAAFARLDIAALAVAAGAVGGFLLFSATAWLLLRGAPPGVHIGPHLGLLVNFLPGYSVSWSGSVTGLVYGGVVGAVFGGLFGTVWNMVHYVYLLRLGGQAVRPSVDG